MTDGRMFAQCPLAEGEQVPASGRFFRRVVVAGIVCLTAAAVTVNVWPRPAPAAPDPPVASPATSAPAASAPSAPAASGRSAPAASGGVVGLGDSVPAGTACDCTSYVALVAKALATRTGGAVPVTNLAVDGETTAGLLEQLQRPVARQALADAAIAIVTIGANDFDPSDVATDTCAQPAACFGAGLEQLRSRLVTILNDVRAAMPQSAEVLVTGYWNVFLDGQAGAAKGSAYVANSDALTRAVNSVTAAAAAGAHATYVDIYTPFKSGADDTDLLAPDGDHPDAAGHEAIAAALIDALT